MFASVYIKDGNIHFYNEHRGLTNIGGIAYELGRPLLDFICYEPDRFDDGFSITVSAFDNDFVHEVVKDPAFVESLKESLDEFQRHEVYVYFYHRLLMDFIYAFLDSPRKAVEQLDGLLPGAKEKLSWAMDFEWPASSSPFVRVVHYVDKERHIYRMAMDVISLMSEHLRQAQSAVIQEIEWLITLREKADITITSSMDYLYMLELYHQELFGHFLYMDTPFRAFYSVIRAPEIAELYEVNTIRDLCRFEFIKMIEHDIFIKKCKNCGRFFIPRRRADAEYCDRIYGEGPRKCSEIGANLRYEKKVAENPILEAYSKAYKRFNSRTRVKKMTQTEFLNWSEEARKLRDQCVAGELSFEEFTAWLDQGRIRKSRRDSQ